MSVPAAQRLKALRDAFQQAHQEGMTALEKGGYEALGVAVTREKQLIEEPQAILDELAGKQGRAITQ